MLEGGGGGRGRTREGSVRGGASRMQEGEKRRVEGREKRQVEVKERRIRCEVEGEVEKISIDCHVDGG